MKNRYIKLNTFAIFTLIIFMLSSCDKEISPKKPIKPSFSWIDTVIRVETYSGYTFMAFETVSIWENTQTYLETFSDSLLGVWENSYSFTSMRHFYSNDTLDQMPVEDPYVAACLSPEGFIQISEKLYKINVSQDLIYVLSEISDSNFDRLLNEEVIPGTIDTYSLWIPVLIPEQELKRTAPVMKKMSTNSNPGKTKSHDGDPWTPEWDYSDYDLDAKLVYQPVGIYFSIINKIQHRAKGGGPKSARTYLKLENVGYWYYTPKNRSQISDYGAPDGNDLYELSHRTYNGIRPLESFNITTRFYWRNKDDNSLDDGDLHIYY